MKISESYYQEIYDSYPSVITKNQLYKICHISKHTALYLLQSGLIPCQCSDKKTRKYKIKLSDVVEYLKDREQSPQKYQAPEGWYAVKGKKRKNKRPHLLTETQKKELLKSALEHLENCDDLLTTVIVAEITGYATDTVSKWCSKKYLHSFTIRNKFLIPKISLVEFLKSKRFRGMQRKSILFDEGSEEQSFLLDAPV